MNLVKINKLIDTYPKISLVKSKNLYIKEQITPELIAKHKNMYAQMQAEEKCLLIVNKKILGSLGAYGFSGIVISNKFLYYKCIKDSFFSSIYAKSIAGKISLQDIVSISIGKHDHCYGPGYMGHQLIINGKVIGLLRMGGSMEYDEALIHNLGYFFKFCEK